MTLARQCIRLLQDSRLLGGRRTALGPRLVAERLLMRSHLKGTEGGIAGVFGPRHCGRANAGVSAWLGVLNVVKKWWENFAQWEVQSEDLKLSARQLSRGVPAKLESRRMSLDRPTLGLVLATVNRV